MGVILMPLGIRIDLNGRPYYSLSIGRHDELYSNTQTSRYSIVSGISQGESVDWAAGVQFNHRYDHGMLVCVRKGLEALTDADEYFPPLTIAPDGVLRETTR